MSSAYTYEGEDFKIVFNRSAVSELEFQSIKSFNLLRIFKRQHSIKISICQNIIEGEKWIGYEIFLRSYG